MTHGHTSTNRKLTHNSILHICCSQRATLVKQAGSHSTQLFYQSQYDAWALMAGYDMDDASLLLVICGIFSVHYSCNRYFTLASYFGNPKMRTQLL